MDVFDILGPIMVGPSSSHTAGAVRIGLATRKLLGEEPTDAWITLHGSFAATAVGHGTDKALIAGLLNMKPDDEQIPYSEEVAKKHGLNVIFEKKNIAGAHPNTALIDAVGINGKRIRVQASSIGGGRIVVNKIGEVEVNVNGDKPTLVIRNMDKPGLVAKVTSVISEHIVNIATMQLYRDRRGGIAVMVIEIDQSVEPTFVEKVKEIDGIKEVTYIAI